MAGSLNVPGHNLLLASLPRDVFARLEPELTKVSVALKQTLLEPNRVIEEVYFPVTGVMSLVLELQDGGRAEVGTVGNEGMVGVPVFLGADTSPTRCFSQVPGDALTLPVPKFREALAAADGVLHRLVARYSQAVLNQISQSVACNHLHSIEQRTARWLLMTHDRVGGDEFPMTQEFLAQMLGVRRPSVTIAAGLLEKAGMIAYKRGRITIVDRERLEATSCECYRVVRAEFDRLLANHADGDAREGRA